MSPRTPKPGRLTSAKTEIKSAAESNAAHITLTDGINKNKPIESFSVGHYDIDLGRGTKGAYLKFDGLFQIWLAKADFINLSTRWQDWTYSSLWNLRFGRLQKYNEVTDIDRIADLAKILLNTSFESYAKEIDNKNKLAALKLFAEGSSQVNLSFYSYQDKIYVRYDFIDIASSPRLEFFASFAKELYYEISKTDWEKIKHEINK